MSTYRLQFAKHKQATGYPRIICDIIFDYLPFDSIAFTRMGRTFGYLNSISLCDGRIIGIENGKAIDNIWVIDTEKGCKTMLPFVGENVCYMHAANNAIFIADSIQNAIYISATESLNEMRKLVELPLDFRPFRISSTSDGKLLCITDFNLSRALLYDHSMLVKDVRLSPSHSARLCMVYDNKDRLYGISANYSSLTR